MRSFNPLSWIRHFHITNENKYKINQKRREFCQKSLFLVKPTWNLRLPWQHQKWSTHCWHDEMRTAKYRGRQGHAVIGNFKNNLHWGVPWIFRNITVTQGWLLREDNLTGQRHDKLKANNCNREQLFRPCWTSSAPWQDPGDGLTFHYIAWDC